MVFNQQEEICMWFKDLEGHARIELICTLFDICLPLELRFLGTYLEYYAGKHYSHLQKFEKDANNNNIVNSETNLLDETTRRRLCIFLALLRSHNRNTATKLYTLLKSFDNKLYTESENLASEPSSKSDNITSAIKDKIEDTEMLIEETIGKDNNEDILALDNEMKLLFTMASYHPAFEFMQRQKMREKLKGLVKDSEHLIKTEKLAARCSTDIKSVSQENLVTTVASNCLSTTVTTATCMVVTKDTNQALYSNQGAVEAKMPLLPSPSIQHALHCSFIRQGYPPYNSPVRHAMPLLFPTGTPMHIINNENNIINQNNYINVQQPAGENQNQSSHLVSSNENNDLKNVMLTPLNIPGKGLTQQYNVLIGNDGYPQIPLQKFPNGLNNSSATNFNIVSDKLASLQNHELYSKSSINKTLNQSPSLLYRRCYSESEAYNRDAKLNDNFIIPSTNNNINKPIIQNIPPMHTYQFMPSAGQNKFSTPGYLQTNRPLQQKTMSPALSLPMFAIPNNPDKTNIVQIPQQNFSTHNTGVHQNYPAHEALQAFDPLQNLLQTRNMIPVTSSSLLNVVYPTINKDGIQSLKLAVDVETEDGVTIPTGLNGGYIPRHVITNGPFKVVTPVVSTAMINTSTKNNINEEKIKSQSSSTSTLPINVFNADTVPAINHIPTNLSIEKLSFEHSPYHSPCSSPRPSPFNSPCNSPMPQRRSGQGKDSQNLSSATEWLKSLRLHKYEEKFKDYTFQMMTELDDNNLSNLGLTKGAKRKLMQHVDSLRRKGFKEFGQTPNHLFTSDSLLLSPSNHMTEIQNNSPTNQMTDITDSSNQIDNIQNLSSNQITDIQRLSSNQIADVQSLPSNQMLDMQNSLTDQTDDSLSNQTIDLEKNSKLKETLLQPIITSSVNDSIITTCSSMHPPTQQLFYSTTSSTNYTNEKPLYLQKSPLLEGVFVLNDNKLIPAGFINKSADFQSNTLPNDNSLRNFQINTLTNDNSLRNFQSNNLPNHNTFQNVQSNTLNNHDSLCNTYNQDVMFRKDSIPSTCSSEPLLLNNIDNQKPLLLNNIDHQEQLSNNVDEDEVFCLSPTASRKNLMLATCYNCGLIGHYGDECTEQTMEAQTYSRYAFHLDFSSSDLSATKTTSVPTPTSTDKRTAITLTESCDIPSR